MFKIKYTSLFYRSAITIFLFVVLVVITNVSRAQKHTDTTALIKELNKVMSFAAQPYLYFSCDMSMHATPSYSQADTNILHSTFFKLDNNLYYGNEQEEIYLQDSLVVRINHARKIIQVNKINMADRDNINIMPLKKTDVQKMLRENYSIAGANAAGDTAILVMQSQEKRTPQGIGTETVQVTYDKKHYWPFTLEITTRLRQPASAQLLGLLAARGIEAQQVIEQKDGQQYINMTQTAAVRFADINTTKEKVLKKPVLTEELAQDDKGGFTGKGTCEGYEVIKTF